jgi:hypothetical protein
LVGHVHPDPVGSFHYLKRLKLGHKIECIVDVLPLHIDYQRKFWLDQGERATKWFTLKQTAGLVWETSLRRILLDFDPTRYPMSESEKPDESLRRASPGLDPISHPDSVARRFLRGVQ